MHHKLITSATIALFATSCLTNNTGYPPAILQANPDILNIPAEFSPEGEGSRTVTVKSNRSWFAHLNNADSPIPVTESVEWGTIDVQDHFNLTGVEDEVIVTLAFHRNYSETKINGVLDFYADGSKFFSLPIEQEGAVYHLNCSPDKTQANCNGDVINISVDCNTDWTAKVEDGGSAAVALDKESGFDPGVVQVLFASNKDPQKEKQASIVFTAGSICKTINLTQGKAEPFLVLAPDNVSTLEAGTTSGRLRIQTNCDWTARVKDGATLKDFALENPSGKGEDYTQDIAFTFLNDGDDPKVFQEATIIVESSASLTPLEFTFMQRPALQICFNNLDSKYTIFTPALPTAYSTVETTHAFTTSCDNTYSISSIFNYIKTFSSGESELIFRQYDKTTDTYCHFSFPAIEELKLTRVILTFRYEKNSYKFKAGIRDASGKKVAPTQSLTIQETGEQLEFILESPEAGKLYMLKAESNNNSYIKQITLFYE